jgi:hypothetical protein
MKARMLVMIAALILVAGFGASRGLASMRASYNGVCVQLKGFPGLLQKMNFFQQGNCRLKGNSTTQCQDNGECTISSPSGNKSGKCRTLATGCTCVVDATSPP